MEHSNSIEKIGTGLVCSLETFKGAKIELVKRKHLHLFKLNLKYLIQKKN